MNMWILQWLGLYASKALAAPFGSSTPTGGISIQNPLNCEEWSECIKNALGGLTILAMPVAGLMILIGGFQIMASGGNEEKLKQGKKTIIYAAVGYAVILLASGVASVIQDIVSKGGS